MSERTPKSLKKRYPNLASEWGDVGTVEIQAVRTSAKEAEKAAHWSHGYQPTVVDFIRRCENDAQALEIIDFLESNGEIEPSYAKRLRVQLAERGLRSFGKRREPGCYACGETG